MICLGAIYFLFIYFFVFCFSAVVSVVCRIDVRTDKMAIDFCVFLSWHRRCLTVFLNDGRFSVFRFFSRLCDVLATSSSAAQFSEFKTDRIDDRTRTTMCAPTKHMHKDSETETETTVEHRKYFVDGKILRLFGGEKISRIGHEKL